MKLALRFRIFRRKQKVVFRSKMHQIFWASLIILVTNGFINKSSCKACDKTTWQKRLCFGLSKNGGQDLDECVKLPFSSDSESDCLMELEIEFRHYVHTPHDQDQLHKILFRGFFSGYLG